MSRFLATLSGLALLGIATVQAQLPTPPPALASYETLHRHIDIDVNADGTYTHTTDDLFLVKTPQGLQHLLVSPIYYSEGMQDGELLQVYTIKPDGRRIDAPVDRALTRSSPAAVNAPTFNDYKAKALPFPNLEVGDKAGMVYRVRQKVPLIPGHFTWAQVFTKHGLSRDVRLTVTAPKDGYPLKIEAVGLVDNPPVIADGKKRWVWTFANETPEPEEPGGVVSEFDTAPRVVISSLPDFAALAKAYESRAREKAAVTPEIRQLAEKLTVGIGDRREQIRSLYDWVSTNVRFVPIGLGAGAIVPHAASEVLANRYGDSKDHVTLLQALLKAKGVESTAVLINSGRSFVISKVATLQQFTHVIAYVPELKLYLDSTARYAPFGILPFDGVDKTVLLTNTGKFDRTPWNPTASTFHTVTTLKVRGDGTAEGETKISTSGPLAIDIRNTIGGIPANQEQTYLRQVLGDAGDGFLDRGKPDNRADPYQPVMRYKLANYLHVPGPGAISLSVGPRLVGRVPWAVEVWTRPRQHHYDFTCPSGRYVDEVIVEFPATIKITSLPKSEEITVAGVRLQTTYTREGEHTIKSVRIFEAAEPHRTCSGEQFARNQPDLARMNRLLGVQVLYQ